MLILQRVPLLGGVKQGRGGENELFWSQMRQYLKLKETRPKLLLMTNRKLQNALSIDVPRSMTLDDLELYKFEFSENFAGFRRFGRQQAKRMKIDPYC